MYVGRRMETERQRGPNGKDSTGCRESGGLRADIMTGMKREE